MAGTFDKSLITVIIIVAIMTFLSVFSEGVYLFYPAGWQETVLLSPVAILIALKTSEKPLMLIGATLAVWGSFLSWWCQGGFVGFCARGIDFYLDYEPFTLNNIGLLVVGVSLLNVLLTYQLIQLKYSNQIVLISSLFLTAFIVFQAISFSLESIEQLSRIGRIYLKVGFVLVVTGVLLQLSSVSRNQKRRGLLWGSAGLIAIMPIWVYAFQLV
ncbi:MAG: hypothetical protein AAF485_02945 [Chloroflexota bacterium]